MATFRSISVIEFWVNGELVQVQAEPDMPLLWTLREQLQLTGTKFGCGKGLCGVCTVHLDDVAVRSCSIPLALVQGRRVTTIEGFSAHGDHPVQTAWVAANAPQCGYCQPGQIMTAAAFLAQNPSPTEDQVVAAMSANLCRCGTYPRIKKAVMLAADAMASTAKEGGR